MDETGRETPEQDADGKELPTTGGEQGRSRRENQTAGADGAGSESLLRRIGFGGIVGGILALLAVAALFVPPVSLLQRLGVVGYETLSAQNPAVSHPDGMTLRVDPESYSGRLRVRLDSVARPAFLEGSAGAQLKEAAGALPSYLQVRSSYYQIETRGEASESVWLEVMIPDGAEPWETLDLYTWDGEEWSWVGSDLHTEVGGGEFIRAAVGDVPESVVLMQAGATEPVRSTYLGAEDDLSEVARFDVVNPTGLLLGTMGGFAGDVVQLVIPDGDTGCAVVPVLRNWAPGGDVNTGLLADMLEDAEIQQAHIDNIVGLCEDRGFDGVEVDYRGVAPEQREAYVSFIEALAGALHEMDLALSVTIEPPAAAGGGWDTGGYDLAALGKAADVVKVPFPREPEAFAEGGEAHQLLDWVTAQVSRYKVSMSVSSLSLAMTEGSVIYEQISVEQALAPLGAIESLADLTEVDPETEMTFALSGSLVSSTLRDETGTYRLQYREDDGGPRTVWLGTAANLAHKLGWAERYNLGGASIADALHPGNMEGVMEVVAGYGSELELPAGEPVEITWAVRDPDGSMAQKASPLTELSYRWRAPDQPGSFEVSASVIGFDHGSVTITVREPEVVEEPTETITETEVVTDPDDDPDEADEELACLSATFVADVTIPDNERLDNEVAFDKTWRLRNNGACAWPEDTVLAFIGGDQMGAPDAVDVGVAEPGEEVDITVAMTAPADDGNYTGNWQLRAEGEVFGTRMWVKIIAGDPQQAEPPPAPPPRGGGGFELGGHIRDWGFPHADRMKYAGMNWAKIQARYPQDVSGIIAASHARGFKIQVSGLGPPDMVTRPGFQQDIANWLAGIAAAGADAIEVWNEPNIDREWQIGHISPQAYTNLLCTAYRAIKNANPNTAVISAAPAPTGYFGGCGPNGCDDLPFLTGMYNAGAAQCMDFLGAHHNAGATSPSARSGHPADGGGRHHSWYFLPQTELYYNAFRGTRRIFYTEMGYASQEGVPPFSDHFSWARGNTNANQAAWLAEAVRLSINTGMVRNIIVWNIDYVRYGYDPQDGYAIIRPDGSCPACDSLHAVLGSR